MSGVSIVVHLLLDGANTKALLSAKDIYPGTVPQEAGVRSLAVETISEVDGNELAPEGWRHVTERVQVTARGEDYVAVHNLIKAAKRDCADQFPAIDELADVSVVPLGGGPEGFDPTTGQPSRTYDFQVDYDEPI